MEDIIISGTTPTITYKFSSIDIAELAKAIMTIKMNGVIKITKELETADVDAEQKTLSWTLTQAETLSVKSRATIMLNWLLQDGTRGATVERNIVFESNHINEVI